MALTDIQNSFSLSILPFFSDFFKLCMSVILAMCVLGVHLDQFRQIIAKLWPLMDVQNCVLLKILNKWMDFDKILQYHIP